jgi:hypothetical protein
MGDRFNVFFKYGFITVGGHELFYVGQDSLNENLFIAHATPIHNHGIQRHGVGQDDILNTLCCE